MLFLKKKKEIKVTINQIINNIIIINIFFDLNFIMNIKTLFNHTNLNFSTKSSYLLFKLYVYKYVYRIN